MTRAVIARSLLVFVLPLTRVLVALGVVPLHALAVLAGRAVLAAAARLGVAGSSE
jgi:hypothetical protein